jgi:hypothetical protein
MDLIIKKLKKLWEKIKEKTYALLEVLFFGVTSGN